MTKCGGVGEERGFLKCQILQYICQIREGLSHANSSARIGQVL